MHVLLPVRTGIASAGIASKRAGRSNVVSFPVSKADTTRPRRHEFDADAMPHLNHLYRTAMRVTGDSARAEDAVQETFLQAWKSFDRFESGTNCRAWLFKILFHCLNHQRRKWFRFPLLGAGEEYMEANLASPEPVASTLTDGEILQALDRLPVDFKAALLLVDVEEFAYKDAAEILGVPIGTVMSRLSRGRKLLRAQLEGAARAYGILKDLPGEAGA
jgi:RNA polymerase sigma-70 factor (ECF subfamily)